VRTTAELALKIPGKSIELLRNFTFSVLKKRTSSTLKHTLKSRTHNRIIDEYVFVIIIIRFPLHIYFGLLPTYIMCEYLSSPVF